MDDQTFLESIVKNKSLSHTIIITFLGFLIYSIYNRLFNQTNSNERRRKSSNENLENLENIINNRNRENIENRANSENLIENKINNENIDDSYVGKLILVWNKENKVSECIKMFQFLKELKYKIYIIYKTNLTDIKLVKEELEQFNILKNLVKKHVR